MDQPTISNPFDEDEKSGRRPYGWAILGLAVICLGTFFAAAILWLNPDPQSLIDTYFPSRTTAPSSTPTLTPTITTTATNTPTPTPNRTATVQAQDAQSAVENAVNNWTVILTDTFDSNKNNWVVDPSDDEYAITNYEVSDGKYRWESTARQSFISWARADSNTLTDFYLSVVIQQIDAPTSADFGVIFREDDNSNFYYFGITDEGSYVLYLFFEEYDTLINWTETDLIKPGKANRITVIGQGSHFTFFINDQYLTEITNDKIPRGTVALAIELANENDHAVFEFDNFELRAP